MDQCTTGSAPTRRNPGFNAPALRISQYTSHLQSRNQVKISLLLFHRARGDQNKNGFSYIVFFSTGAERHFDVQPPQTNGMVMSKLQQALVRAAQGMNPEQGHKMTPLFKIIVGFQSTRCVLSLRNVQVVILEVGPVQCFCTFPSGTPTGA